jgi:glycosyltransferase involved in cell wall biosynthesis
MRVALVHDYLYEFGGAERVLLALSEIWPEAPIYTAFCKAESSAAKRFAGKDIRVSWFHYLPFASKLASPLRFLAPLIWNSFNLLKYDVVISSANWYITKGLKKGSPSTDSTGSPQASSRQKVGQAGQVRPIEICYCHTPPRYLYGYSTSVKWRKYWPVRIYGEIVGHFLRMIDYRAAQRVDFFVANSRNVQRRIKKFYRRDAKVIYPPVSVPEITGTTTRQASGKDYYLVVSRIVGGKGLELAIEAANRLRVPLKVVGRPAGWGAAGKRLRELAGNSVEFLGEVTDKKLASLYAGARAFLATAEDEDFGITPVEAMAAGTPVVAFKGGGYIESVVEGKTGMFFSEYSVESLVETIKKFKAQSSLRTGPEAKFKVPVIQKHVKKFSKERFKEEMKEFVGRCIEKRSYKE